MGILLRDNEALRINRPAGDETLNTHGSDWLWAATAVYVLSLVVFFGLTIKPRAGERIFHYIYTGALFVGAISYFAMASDLGFSVVAVAENADRGATYQVFFAKYINWVVSFPAVILSLGLLSGISWTTIFFNIFTAWVWVVAYLCAAYTTTVYKWGFFCFGTVAWAYLAVQTLTVGVAGARRVGVEKHYLALAGWTNLLWLLYPIAFGLSDGGNKIGVVGNVVFFGVLDVLMIPVLAFAFVGLSTKWDYGKLNLHFTQYGRVARAGEFPEKAAAATGAVGEQAA